jgi:small subunit ribosomal protein S1
MPEAQDRPGRTAGAEEDFASLFEQSLKTPLQGDVIMGRVVSIGRDAVTIDIGYKCEGSIPLHEFLDHDGACTVALGDDVDVFFEGTDQSRRRASVSAEGAAARWCGATSSGPSTSRARSRVRSSAR